MNRESVDAYLRDGCGRCDHYRTPSCKVHRWTEALVALRALLAETALVETMKWGSPCYTLAGKNVVMLVSQVDSCALSFFKGAALADPEGRLELPGPNSRFARLLRFGSVDEALAGRTVAAAFVEKAIAAERAGIEVRPAATVEEVPEALQRLLDEDPALAAAFEALTPGRQRSHRLYVAGAKQPATQARRAARCTNKILAGRGYHER